MRVIKIDNQCADLINSIIGKRIPMRDMENTYFVYSIGHTVSIKYDPYICMREGLPVVVNAPMQNTGSHTAMDLSYKVDKLAFFRWVQHVESLGGTPDYDFVVDWSKIPKGLFEIYER